MCLKSLSIECRLSSIKVLLKLEYLNYILKQFRPVQINVGLLMK